MTQIMRIGYADHAAHALGENLACLNSFLRVPRVLRAQLLFIGVSIGRQVLECGDGACGAAAFELEQA